MGNALRFLCGHFCSSSAAAAADSLGHHGVSPATVGVSALAHDLFDFEITSQVPQGLSKHVVSSKKAQANWYRKLADAWRSEKPPPKTPEEASRLVIQTLKRHQKKDVEGLLAFYGLPLPHTLVELSTPAPAPTSLPEGVKYELQTLPIDAKAVADGDTVTVYVSTTHSRESSCVPKEVRVAATQRSQARNAKNYAKADALHKIITDAGYRVLTFQNEEILARKYRIRLRGIDAPESAMPYGKEAKEELLKLVEGKCLRVLVYGEDRYNRCVGDLYCNGKFIQGQAVCPVTLIEMRVNWPGQSRIIIKKKVSGYTVISFWLSLQEAMLKKGFAWHYHAYDKRPELAKWENEARAKRIGLWASRNPEQPWEWRKAKRGGK